MSASRCMHHASRIIDSTDRERWGDEIDKLPTECPHTDCGQPKNCRERIREYLRVQYRLSKHAERQAALRAMKAMK